MLRWLLPPALILPTLLGVLLYLGEKHYFYSHETTIILFGLITILLCILVISTAAFATYNAERKLLKSEKLSRLLVENRKDYAIFSLDNEGNVTSWNAGAERLLGYTSEEVLGKSHSYFFSNEDKLKNKPNELLELVRKEKQIEYQGWRIKKNREPFWATMTMSVILGKNNEMVGFTKLLRNSTLQKEADDKMKELIIRLERSNKELERFAYIASHDLQEPLRMVSSYTQLLAKKYKDKLDPEAQEFINYAVDGALRMQELIIDLLSYSRIATKGNPFVPLDSELILTQALQNLSVTIQETGAKITHDKLPSVIGDNIQLLQVFQNLISNAIKFHDKNTTPEIHIFASELSNEWCICFKDNGIGIPPESHEKIFLIFQRLHSRYEYSGTGVGLAICKKIIDRHGGKIWVESKPGEGATFCFTIPKR